MNFLANPVFTSAPKISPVTHKHLLQHTNPQTLALKQGALTTFGSRVGMRNLGPWAKASLMSLSFC